MFGGVNAVRAGVMGEANLLAWEYSRQTVLTPYFRLFQHKVDQLRMAEYLRDQIPAGESIGVVGRNLELELLSGVKVVPLAFYATEAGLRDGQRAARPGEHQRRLWVWTRGREPRMLGRDVYELDFSGEIANDLGYRLPVDGRAIPGSIQINQMDGRCSVSEPPRSLTMERPAMLPQHRFQHTFLNQGMSK